MITPKLDDELKVNFLTDRDPLYSRANKVIKRRVEIIEKLRMLSQREKEALHFRLLGFTWKEMGYQMDVKPETAYLHFRNIYAKIKGKVADSKHTVEDIVIEWFRVKYNNHVEEKPWTRQYRTVDGNVRRIDYD